MNGAELRELLSIEGLALLDSLPPYRSADDVLRLVAGLRSAGHPPSLVATVLTQSKLRARAAAKFGPFAERMLFTEIGLEQATRLPVAARHAGRFARAGLRRVADLGCGIGADSLALAALDLEVLAVERDEVTAAVATYNLAPWPAAQVAHGSAEGTRLDGVDGAYLDPARREGARRLRDADDWSPSLDFGLRLADTLPVGMKLGPGADRGLIPATAEAQWVSVGGDVVELGLWFGSLARPGIGRAALIVTDDGEHELTSADDSDDVEVGPLGEYLFEPDGAVIRARLIGDLARAIGGRMLDRSIAYVTADAASATPFASCFRVLAEFPLDAAVIRREVAARRIGVLEIKKRGVDVDPALFRAKLALKGETSATLILTRFGGRRRALLAERVASEPQRPS